MYKIFRDTLTKPDRENKGQRRFCKQSLTFFVSFILAIILGVTNLIVSYVSGIVNNPTADNVFNSFMFLTAGLSGTNIVNKFVEMKKGEREDYNQYNDNEPRRDTY